MAPVFLILVLPRVIGLLNGPPAATCELHRDGDGWAGTCGVLFDAPSSLRLRVAAAVTTGRWRRGSQPAFVWAGEAELAGLSTTPLEIEADSTGRGVARTAVGWFPIHALERTVDRLRFQLDTSAEVDPSDVDGEILQRASEILSTVTAWDRADDRVCSPQDATWSIYCSLHRATIEVAGAFHHRRPALQVVRALVDERSAGRNYEHRLRDYNNDPSTQLVDVQSLFHAALARVGKPRS